jgi:hypothetical protein
MKRKKSPEVVYFIVDETDRTVKVGRTTNEPQRLAQLQTASAVRLRYLGCIPGGAKSESLLHAALAPHRIQGEWFRLTDEVRVLVEGSCAAHRLNEDRAEEGDLVRALEATIALVCKGQPNCRARE